MTSRWLRIWLPVCTAIALAAAVWSIYQVSLAPPSLTPRKLDMATATTSFVVDTKVPALVDPQRDGYSFKDLMDRAVLLGSVMADGPLHAEIAKAAGVPDDRLHIEAPVTPDKPHASVDASHQPSASDILRSNDQYRLDLEVNPSVPVLEVLAQGPSPVQAEKLADAAFTASRAYVDELSASEKTPPELRPYLSQLGPARGVVINNGVELQIAFVVFILTFLVVAAVIAAVKRIGRGWRVAVLTEKLLES